MSDLVVTIPKTIWTDWIAEGDLPGDPDQGEFWSYYTGGAIPARVPTAGRWDADHYPEMLYKGEPLDWRQMADAGRVWHLAGLDVRCYVVAHGKLRGYSSLFALETDETGRELKALIRRGGAVAVTTEEAIPGFRGWRYRWWGREDERPFPEWKTP